MFEVMQTDDKEVRDRVFHDLRANGNDTERQAAKWSSCRPTGKLDAKGRLAWISTWFVGHPADPANTVVPVV